MVTTTMRKGSFCCAEFIPDISKFESAETLFFGEDNAKENGDNSVAKKACAQSENPDKPDASPIWTFSLD